MFGLLPVPSTDTSILDSGISDDEFPHNVFFCCADWINERIPEDEASYDVIMG
jgi:7SK snRNA methylphosphate capping enzyme